MVCYMSNMEKYRHLGIPLIYKLIFFVKIIVLSLFMCVWVLGYKSICHICEGICRSQKRSPDILDLALQVAVSLIMCILENEFANSGYQQSCLPIPTQTHSCGILS